MSEIKLPSSSSMEEGKDRKDNSVCPLCLKQPAKYTCPRCNVPYCSVDCYKSEKHLQCSEAFYRDCFMDGLKDCSGVDPEEKSKIVEMLSRVEKQSDQCEITADSEEEEEEDLHSRLENLNLDKDTEKIWKRLTDKEKREFESMIQDGRLGNLVEIWTPWWVVKETKLVTEMDVVSHVKTLIPEVRGNIPHISTLLTKSKPSSDVKYNLLNILYAYTFVCRLHNGEHLKHSVDSSEDLLKVSAVMGQGQVYGSTREAIQACFSIIHSLPGDFSTSQEQNISIIKDVLILLQGPTNREPLLYIMAALSELYQTFRKACKVLSKQIKNVPEDSSREEMAVLKKKLFRCEKQTDFFLSWTQTYGMAAVCLIPEVELELSALSSELTQLESSCRDLEIEWGGKVKPQRTLIQEIN